jgi:hypothetical protein
MSLRWESMWPILSCVMWRSSCRWTPCSRVATPDCTPERRETNSAAHVQRRRRALSMWCASMSSTDGRSSSRCETLSRAMDFSSWCFASRRRGATSRSARSAHSVRRRHGRAISAAAPADGALTANRSRGRGSVPLLQRALQRGCRREKRAQAAVVEEDMSTEGRPRQPNGTRARDHPPEIIPISSALACAARLLATPTAPSAASSGGRRKRVASTRRSPSQRKARQSPIAPEAETPEPPRRRFRSSACSARKAGRAGVRALTSRVCDGLSLRRAGPVLDALLQRCAGTRPQLTPRWRSK